MDAVSVIYGPTETRTAAESVSYCMFCELSEIGLLINLMNVEDEKDSFLNMLMD